jgi:hypothetical protein
MFEKKYVLISSPLQSSPRYLAFFTEMNLSKPSIPDSNRNNAKKQFLDFPSIPTYHPNGFFISLTSLSPNGTFNPGEKMRSNLRGMDHCPTIIVCLPL